MRKKDIIINSNSDKLPISVTMFIPEVDIKGIVWLSIKKDILILWNT